MKNVIIYTDGACSGNPGPGGWGAILKFGEVSREISGGEENTTNNRMELTAVIKALSMLKEPCNVELYSDSAYVINAFAKGWIADWMNNGWRKSNKEPVKNPDLWQQLYELSERHSVSWMLVKGHADNEFNNRCDELAVAESKKFAPAVKESPSGGVVVVAVDDNQEVLMVSRFRSALNIEMTELPAGKLRSGEDTVDAAARELEAETGYKAGSLELLTSMIMSPDTGGEELHVFLATDLEKGTKSAEYKEILISEKKSLDVLVEGIFTGEITDSKTIVGLLMADRMING